MKIYILLFVLLLSAHTLQAEEPTWMVQLSGGLMFSEYDRKIDDSQWEYRYKDSTVAALDIHHSVYFHQEKWQLFYGVGGEHIKSVSELGASRIETTGYGLILRAGMLYHPPGMPISFGHSIGILALDDYSTRFYSQNFQTNFSKNEFILFDQLINSLWFKWKFSSQFRLFTRFDIRRLDDIVVSQNLGVEYAF